jgi:hypothetical protein
MDPATSDLNASPVRRLLTGLLDADTPLQERERIWDSLQLWPSRQGVVVILRERTPSGGLLHRLTDVDPDCVAVVCGSEAVSIAPHAATLRRFVQMTAGLRAGVGNMASLGDLHLSYARSLEALAFTDYGSPVSRAVSNSELGALTLLARVPREELLKLPDLAAIMRLDEEEGGRADLEALEALCRTGTLRSAAKLLHLHHSSIAKRIRNVERALGYRLTDPLPKGSAYIALLALRLLKPEAASEEY